MLFRSIAAAAVNLDPRESDIRPMPVEDFKPGDKTRLSVLSNEEETSLSGKARQLWPELAAAGALFLAIEMLILALWPARRQSGTNATRNQSTTGAGSTGRPPSINNASGPRSARREDKEVVA